MARRPSILDCAFAAGGIPSNAKLLLLAMAKLGNQTGQCFASQRTLSQMCCCNKRTVRRALTHLRAKRLVTEIRNPTGTTKRYLLNFDRWGFSQGQNVLGVEHKSPPARGQRVRQNQDLNHELNQRAENRRLAGASSGSAIEVAELLKKIEKGQDWYLAGEGESDA